MIGGVARDGFVIASLNASRSSTGASADLKEFGPNNILQSRAATSAKKNSGRTKFLLINILQSRVATSAKTNSGR